MLSRSKSLPIPHMVKNTHMERNRSFMKKSSMTLRVGLRLKQELDRSQKQPHLLKWSLGTKRLKRIETQEPMKFNIGRMYIRDTPGSPERESDSIWSQHIEMFLSPLMRHITKLSILKRRNTDIDMSLRFLRDLMSLQSIETNQRLGTPTNTNCFTGKRQRHDITQPSKKMLGSNMRLVIELKRRQSIIQSIT